MNKRYYVSRDDYCAVVKDRNNDEYFLGADVIAARLNQLEKENKKLRSENASLLADKYIHRQEIERLSVLTRALSAQTPNPRTEK